MQTSSSRDQVWNATNFKKESQRQDVGTEIKAEGAVLLKAGQDLSATAAQIASAQGAVTLSAGRDVELLAGEANKVVEEMTQKTKKSLFKKKTVTTYNKTDTTTAIGTTLSGDTVNIVAGRDITLAAAQAVSDNGTKLIADRDITIDGVTNSVDTEQFKKTVKSGLFSGGGIGVTIGKQELSQATKTSQETHQGSVVASVAGDVDIYAGGKYRQVGSEVQAPQGDVTIKGKSIDIVEARNQSAQDTETKFRQSGLSLSLSAPGVDAAMGAIKAGEHVTQTQDDRMKALAAATAISKAKQAVEEIQKFNDLAKAQQEQSIRISLSVGSQQSKSSQHNEANQAAGSSVLADGKLSLIATGGGQDSNVTVRGSTLAGQDVFIKADNKIDLLAAQNTSEQHSKDSSSSASIGIGISLGKENRLGFTASASVSKGNADGKDTNYSATQVTGGSSVTLQSGGDTTLGGAVVTAPKVVADIGGNLKIESLQDTAKFDSKSQSMGGSVTVGYGAGGSANFSQSKVNADYAAVGEQAGIRAGDGGFQVSVKGNTELKGGAITSSQAAIDAGKNSFSTGTLTSSDIDNRSQFSASAVTVSAGTSGGMAGAFKDSGDERSTTRSTISAGSTTITSGDAASQATLEKLDRGATNDATAGKLSQGWDGQKLAQQVKVNAQIVAEFGAQASKEVAEQFKKQADKLRAEGKEQEAKKYEEGGEYRVAAHAVIGAMTGDLSGALGAAASAKVADQLNSLQETLRDRLDKAGLGGEGQKNDWATALSKLASGALATGIGAIAGGGFDGAAAGLNQDYNNRQLHPKERDKAAELAKRSKGKYTQEQIEDAMRNSGNSYYKEDVTAGMVIRDPKDPNAFYDKGAPFTTGDNGKSFVQINRDNTALNSSNIDPDLAAFVRANTGGENSPYYDLAPKKITYPELAQSGKATGLQYQTVSANGQSFRLAIADCPAVSCQNTDNIARFGLSAEDKAQLDAYDAAVKKSLTKDAVKGGIVVAVGVTAPVTLPGAVVGGAVIGGASSTSDQYIDKGKIDGEVVAREAVIGGALGAGGVVTAKVIGAAIQKTGQTLDDLVASNVISRAEADAYVAVKSATNVSEVAGGAVASGEKVAIDRAAAIHPENPLLGDAITRKGDRLVVNQGDTPTCGHNSCVMAGDTLGTSVDLFSLVKTFPPTGNGVYLADVAGALKFADIPANAYYGKTVQDLERFTSDGVPVIVRIKNESGSFSNFVVVDGVTNKGGVPVVAIRDPHGVQYFSPVESFKRAFTGEVAVPKGVK